MDITTAKVLITGGSSGIGFETARRLAMQGARVAICGRDAAKLRRAADDLGAFGVECDVAREDHVIRMIESVVEAFDGFNVLINNAGFGHFAPLVETKLEDMQRIYATNVFGAMVVARESAKHFITAGKGGNIVNIASTAGQRGFAGGTAYASSKFAVSGMTECWRAELRKHDIRVMQINPSEVQTAFFRGRAFSERKLRGEEIAHAIISMLAMDDRGFTTEMSVWATNPD
jgi:3-oxoacyl-[acyl-carrier protein] reductase